MLGLESYHLPLLQVIASPLVTEIYVYVILDVICFQLLYSIYTFHLLTFYICYCCYNVYIHTCLYTIYVHSGCTQVQIVYNVHI